ncbi:hypothetical protein FB567DRAFT_593917 [Paraphoma chrysanthemicola]|uniref:NmrA-like domain-containing protein n=1 Tax=Paraphoma chrysanthemicola TaxID=798071 RepID=A0A8K0R2W4_9PLEO|nr:hypothetical protein FB567DRAFT_593917 [Paraphoma chrysanthemicola]
MASKVVAVAGGSGKLGRAIVDELVAHGGYTVYVLGREASAEKSKEIGAQILAIDYNDVDGIVKTLESNNIDTLVSTIGSGSMSADPELALIAASDKSKVTKRYIPSLWGIKYTPEIAKIFPIANIKLTLLSALSKTSLQYTSVINGFFLDYFGIPHTKTYLGAFPLVLDIPSAHASIPGTGNTPIAFTYTFDIGRYVAQTLLPNPVWAEDSIIVGDKLSWTEFLAIAEDVTGKKFSVSYDSVEALEKGQVTELPGQKALYQFLPKEMLLGMVAVFGLMMERGVFDLEGGEVGFKTKTAREIVEEAWRGK